MFCFVLFYFVLFCSVLFCSFFFEYFYLEIAIFRVGVGITLVLELNLYFDLEIELHLKEYSVIVTTSFHDINQKILTRKVIFKIPVHSNFSFTNYA